MSAGGPDDTEPEASSPPEAETIASARATERRKFIEQRAIALGQSWAQGWRRDLQQQGRAVAGGWPGTLREARTYVERALATELRGRKMTAISTAEREAATKVAYASARNEWRKHVEPEGP
ncbi:hypothetical protein [Chondromyces apiculatus]|uniref:Uncharacterized protein n=1 Tax=Chondromyces apiculatus DSM 436 TaxID=1192034 RepID=A0A017TEL9_9BACT|nr:hypothetical protein [Chondromyces apiculatus]EYF07679.1 Hypothetical protein CAP_8180 [Chondromyces apiculatus DSM 436]